MVYAESVIGNYRSESLGDVLYFSTDGKEKTEVEKEAEKAVMESEARHDAETNISDTLTPLGVFKITGYCPCYSCSEGFGRRTASGRAEDSTREIPVMGINRSGSIRILINSNLADSDSSCEEEKEAEEAYGRRDGEPGGTQC